MNADETAWRALVQRHGDDPDREVQTAVFLMVALLRKFPPSLRPQIVANVTALLAEPAGQLETAIGNAGDPGVGERFARTVSRIVRKRAS